MNCGNISSIFTPLYPGRRKPRLCAVTHFGVQAWPLVVDECAVFWPGSRPTGTLIWNHGLCPWGSTVYLLDRINDSIQIGLGDLKMNLMEMPFISFLIEKGLIRQEDLVKIASSNGEPKGISIEELLLASGLLTENKFQSCLEEFYGVPLATQEDFPKETVLVNHLSIQFMKESRFVPARLMKNELTVIMSNPLDFYTIDAIRLATGYDVRVLYGKEEGIHWAIEQHYGSGVTSMEKIIEDIDGIPEYNVEDEENVDHLRDMASEGPVIRLVNLIITRAIELRASDIHFEPFEDQFRVRYRIDGVLHDVESPPKAASGSDRFPCQNHGQIEYCRKTPSAGWKDHAPGEREGDRFQGLFCPHDLWRKHRLTNFGQEQHRAGH